MFVWLLCFDFGCLLIGDYFVVCELAMVALGVGLVCCYIWCLYLFRFT